MGPEKTFENKVKAFLESECCWYVKYWGGGTMTKAGIPDLLINANGCFIGCEIKADNGQPTALQIRNLIKINDSGGLAVLLYPDNFELFKRLESMCWIHGIEYARKSDTYGIFQVEIQKWKKRLMK